MSNHILGKIEQQRNEPFSVAEIKRLLTPNASGKYEHLESFYEQQQISQWLPLEEFKKMLEERLNAIRELLYFKDLEDRLSTKVEKKIEQTAGDFHTQIADLLHHETVLDEDILESIRNTRSQDFYSGQVVIEADTVTAYAELVQKELKKQIEELYLLDSPDNGGKKRNLYERTINLIEFMVAQSDVSSGTRSYVSAYLYKKLRSKDGWKYIRDLYQEGAIYEKDSVQGRSVIQDLIQKVEKESRENREKHIFDVLREYAPDLDFSPSELEDMRNYGVRMQGDISYDQLIANRLSEVERAIVEIELENMSSEPNKKLLNDHASTISREVLELRNGIESFRNEKYTIEYLVEKMPSEVADEVLKSQLIRVSHFMRDKLGESSHTVRFKLMNLDSSEKINDFIQDQEKKAEQYLCNDCIPPFSREELNVLKKNDPGFDIFEVVTDQERYANRPKPKSNEPSEYFDEREEEDIKDHILLMEKIARNNFSDPDDMKRFESAEKELKRILEKSAYQVQVPSFTKKDPLTSEDIHGEMETEERQKRFPPHLLIRYQAVAALKENYNRFKRSRESILRLNNFEDESQLRTGLGAFFADYFEVNESKGMEVNKLTKVMSLDHPLTCIRFNASDKKPFDSRRGTYDFHKLDGRPATYKQRSVALMKTVQQCLQSGDFSQLMKLFTRGEKADRLYMDSIFFPVSAIKNTEERDGIIYDTLTTSEENGAEVKVLSKKIPSNARGLFKDFEDWESEKFKNYNKKYDEDDELNKLGASLDEDESFTKAFEEMDQYLEMAQMYMDSLVFQEDGSTTTDPDKIPFSSGGVAGLGLVSAEDLRLNRAQILELMKHSPLVAARAAQFNGVGRGYVLGGAQLAARETLDLARLPIQYGKSFAKLYWKSLKFYSLTSIFIAAHEFYEHVANLADFGRKFKAYTLLKETFAGTIIGSEFAKLQQSKENERVDAFKGAFAQYGNEDIRDKLLNPRDRFELKATMIEGFDNRGLFTIEDILRNEVFDVINKYTPSKIIPKKYTDKEMREDLDKKAEMTNHVREALDNIWGQGTWSGWRTNGASKYESNRKAANDNFNNNTGSEKMKVFTQWWKYLKLPDDNNNPLTKIAPAELVGSIENDMQRCNNDSGEIFAIMQALICKGYIRLEHVARLQDIHVNDLPIYTLLEPEQARLSGMEGYIQKALDEDKPYTIADNPILQFYQGKRALKLKAVRDVGKWKIPKTQKDFDEAVEKKTLEEVYLTAHELQKVREPQPKFIKEMDNGVTGIYGPAYSIEKILNSYQRNAQGDIDMPVRDHDVVALYRGMHEKMAAYLKVLGDMDQEISAEEFKRNVYYAYNEIGKSSAFASYLAAHAEREDLEINTADGSPNYDSKLKTKTGLPKGLSAFEKLIISNSGRAQRLNESNESLDTMPDDDGFKDFRKKFKLMAGYQYTLGVSETDGKKSGHPATYKRRDYRPADTFKEVMSSFQNHVLALAKKREKKFGTANFHEEIRQSLDRSSIANFKLNNEKRQEKITNWKIDEAKLDS